MIYIVLKDIVNCPKGSIIHTVPGINCDLWRDDCEGDYIICVLQCDIKDSIEQGFIKNVRTKGKQGVTNVK